MPEASQSRVSPWRNTHRGEEAWPPVWNLRLEVKPKGSLTGREDNVGGVEDSHLDLPRTASRTCPHFQFRTP